MVMTLEQADLMVKAYKLIRSWSPERDKVAEVTAQVLGLVEELGEAIEAVPGAMRNEELADVVIVANMISLELSGTLVTEVTRSGRDWADDIEELTVSVGRVAKIWRQISGLRKRASAEEFTLKDLDAALSDTVAAARGARVYGSALPVSAKLTKILAQGLWHLARPSARV